MINSKGIDYLFGSPVLSIFKHVANPVKRRALNVTFTQLIIRTDISH